MQGCQSFALKAGLPDKMESLKQNNFFVEAHHVCIECKKINNNPQQQQQPLISLLSGEKNGKNIFRVSKTSKSLKANFKWKFAVNSTSGKKNKKNKNYKCFQKSKVSMVVLDQWFSTGVPRKSSMGATNL